MPSQEKIVEDPENYPLLPPSASAATQSAATNNNRKQKAQHPILIACTYKDRCYENIDQNRQENLHNEYWDNSYNDRKGWIFNNSSIISSKTPAPNRKRRKYFFYQQEWAPYQSLCCFLSEKTWILFEFSD